MGCSSFNDYPDPDYNFFQKVESQQKDGLDIYKATSPIDGYTQLRCPLCKCLYSNEEKRIIKNIIYYNGEKRLLMHIENYNGQANSPKIIDDINELESIYNRIQEIAITVEQNRYHKHTCTKNELCQRANDQSIYLDLCSIDNINNYIEKNLKINLNKLKNDINYRNEYLQNKKIHNDLYLKKQRKLEIERLYKSGFEEYTFNLEEPLYRHIISNIELELGYYQREIENNPYAIDTRATANTIWQIKSRDLNIVLVKKN